MYKFFWTNRQEGNTKGNRKGCPYKEGRNAVRPDGIERITIHLYGLLCVEIATPRIIRARNDRIIEFDIRGEGEEHLRQHESIIDKMLK